MNTEKKQFTLWAWQPGKRYPTGGWDFDSFRDALIFSQGNQFTASSYKISAELETGDRRIYNKRKIKSLIRKGGIL